MDGERGWLPVRQLSRHGRRKKLSWLNNLQCFRLVEVTEALPPQKPKGTLHPILTPPLPYARMHAAIKPHDHYNRVKMGFLFCREPCMHDSIDPELPDSLDNIDLLDGDLSNVTAVKLVRLPVEAAPPRVPEANGTDLGHSA